MEGSFISETRRQITDFYRDLVQGLMPPQIKAPKIREEVREETTPPDSGEAATEKSEGEASQEHVVALQRLAQMTPFASS